MTYTLVCWSVGWVVRRATCPVAVWSAYSVRGRPVTRCRFGSPPRPSPYRAGLGHDCHASVVTSCGQGLLCVLRPLAGVPHGLVLSICPSMPTRVHMVGPFDASARSILVLVFRSDYSGPYLTTGPVGRGDVQCSALAKRGDVVLATVTE